MLGFPEAFLALLSQSHRCPLWLELAQVQPVLMPWVGQCLYPDATCW